MQAERDHLRDVVFPELAERLRARHHHLEHVDLRWGVATADAAGEEAKEALVLKVCLDEVERCRPFIVVVLGDRYGWVPPRGRMEAAVGEKGLAIDVEGMSVTALEIESGVLDSPDQHKRTFFYLRKPLPYAKMPAELASIYSEEHAAHPGATGAARRLRSLKDRIERE
jgi:hypothetical protein